MNAIFEKDAGRATWSCTGRGPAQPVCEASHATVGAPRSGVGMAGTKHRGLDRTNRRQIRHGTGSRDIESEVHFHGRETCGPCVFRPLPSRASVHSFKPAAATAPSLPERISPRSGASSWRHSLSIRERPGTAGNVQILSHGGIAEKPCRSRVGRAIPTCRGIHQPQGETGKTRPPLQ